MRELVDGAAEGTKSALSECLKACRRQPELFEELKALLSELNDKQWTLETLTEENVTALNAVSSTTDLYRLLLGSFWLAPAFELAFGLQGRPEARDLWKARQMILSHENDIKMNSLKRNTI